MTDKLFWEIAVNDNEQAFQTLFYQFFTPLCTFAHRYIEQWETCEDIVQESFLKIWENRKNIHIEQSSRNFLITSVRNGCIDYLRKQELEFSWRQQQTDIETESVGDVYSVTELRNLFTAALDKLPENTRLIFEKSRFEGKKYAEIAEEQHISIKTVEAHISRALQLLRFELKDYLPLLLMLFCASDRFI